MSVRPVGAIAGGLAALALMAGCAQPAAQTDSIRTVAAVAPIHHPAKAAIVVRHPSVASTEARLDASSEDSAPARADADDHHAVAKHVVTAPAAGTPCALALAAVRGLVAGDSSEDRTEPANAMTDMSEDQAEATALRAAAQKAATACLPAQASRCTLATNALNAINAQQAQEDAWESAHALPAAVAQLEDQVEARILAAAGNAVTTACAV